jgi:predicted Zn-dependent protease
MKARALVLALLVLGAACSTVPETGRKRIVWIPDSVMSSMGASAYAEETSKYPEIKSGPQYEMVQRLGQRLAQASKVNYDWEFKLLNAPDIVNAFCLPGGKVAIYTGILKVAPNEDALAAVVGHEIAHATAQHGNERMTQSMIAEGALSAADIALGSWGKMDQSSRASWMEALGMGAQIGVLLPFSREHESEADEIGLRYLIRAGYNPNEAPALWERMAKMEGGKSQPGWMSTHPPSMERAERLRKLIPTIMKEEGRG